MARKKSAPVRYEHKVTYLEDPKPLSPELRQQLVNQFARLLEADWRRRHPQEPSATPTDVTPADPLETSRRKR